MIKMPNKNNIAPTVDEHFSVKSQACLICNIQYVNILNTYQAVRVRVKVLSTSVTVADDCRAKQTKLW